MALYCIVRQIIPTLPSLAIKVQMVNFENHDPDNQTSKNKPEIIERKKKYFDGHKKYKETTAGDGCSN